MNAHDLAGPSYGFKSLTEPGPLDFQVPALKWNQPALTEILRGVAFSTFGKISLKTPSFNWASILS